jgi:ABC-type polysaccharide/polyol phosphate transport system ATPase subunit
MAGRATLTTVPSRNTTLDPRIAARSVARFAEMTQGYACAVSAGLPVITVDNVAKTFVLPHERVHTLKERALHPFRRVGSDSLQALLDISFEVRKGEFFGIVGRNGSGKSTLLKCLAGIYALDEGDIYVDGRMSTFIELGVGFNMDLPARDNVLINATLLGLSPREAARRFERVMDFAELWPFVDLKLKNYSSGMLVRLAFAVMIQVDADILLIDEVLAVGDAAFQQKCYEEFARIRESGATVLLVTHDMAAVQRFCDRAILLEHGEVIESGDPQRVGNRYLDVNFQGPQAPKEDDRFGDGRADIHECWFEDERGERATVLPSGRPCSFVMRVRFREPVEDPIFGVVLQNSRRDTVFTANTLASDPEPGVFAPGEEVTMRLSFDLIFASDRYHATPAVARAGTGIAWLDRRERFASVMVKGGRDTDGIVDLPHRVEIERAPARHEVAG